MAKPDCFGPEPPYEDPLGQETFGSFVVILNEAGSPRVLMQPGDNRFLFWNASTGQLYFLSLDDRLLPGNDAGDGYIHRLGGIVQFVTGIGGGLAAEDGSNNPIFIPYGDVGEVLTISSPGVATFEPATVAGVAGAIPPTLDFVTCRKTGSGSVSVVADQISLSDGTDTIAVSGINETITLSGPNGLNGIDVGAEASSQFYYIYAVSDGVTHSAMASLNSNTPSFANAAGYSFYARVGVFRNDGSSNIEPFVQQGHNVAIDKTATSGASLTAVAGVQPVASAPTLAAIIPPIAKAVTANVTAETTSLTLHSDPTGEVGRRIGAAPTGEQCAVTGADIVLDNPASPMIYWETAVDFTDGFCNIVGYTI